MALPTVLLAGLALGLGLVCVDAKAAPGQGSFTLAPRSNTSSEPSLGCGATVNWPGTQFADNQWTYTPYGCEGYWSYTFTINVTAQPSGFAPGAVTSGFQPSSVTIANTGSCAGFDYLVTLECPSNGNAATYCSGTLEPSEPSVNCQIATVPQQWEACEYDYTAAVVIDNRNWVCSADGSITVTQTCTDGAPAGADLCSNGTFYGFLNTESSTPIVGYVTGGCVSDLAPNANCGSAAFCCPNGSPPSTWTYCGSGDGTTDSYCYNCGGGC